MRIDREQADRPGIIKGIALTWVCAAILVVVVVLAKMVLR